MTATDGPGHAIRFVPYGEAAFVPNIIVDGAAAAETVLTLSHWPHSGTPPELMADTSAEIVFNYLDAPGFHVDVGAASNNHFDEDGLIGLFALVQPEAALRHRDLLIDASRAGDFGVYRDRRAARVAFVLAGYASRQTSPLPHAIFSLPYPRLASSLYVHLLELLPTFMTRLADYQSLWEPEDTALTASERLIDEGTISIEEQADLDLAVVHLPPDLSRHHLRECHPYTLHSRTSCTRILLVQGHDVELQYRYEGWVQMATRRPAPRVDLAPLADELNQHETSGRRWAFDGVDQITPRLHLDGTGGSSIPAEMLVERIGNSLRTGAPAWNPYD